MKKGSYFVALRIEFGQNGDGEDASRDIQRPLQHQSGAGFST